MTNKSPSIANLMLALSKAQAEMPVALFDAKNPFLKSKYATLGAVISASKPVLAKNGLALTQFPVSEQGRIGVTSVLAHESGEWIEDTITMVPEHNKGVSEGQAAGIVITYLRRYAWASILGMYADEDEDGNMAAQMAVTEVMKADPKTGEIARTWSLAQLEAGYRASGETNEDYEEVGRVLGMSVLPDSAPEKTIESWYSHYMKAEGSDVERAQAANEAYIKAKSKKTGGK